MLTRVEIEKSIKILLVRYNAEYALLFGSYARGEETPDSDVDVLVFGGENFKKSNIFAFAEELRKMTEKKWTHSQSAKWILLLRFMIPCLKKESKSHETV